MARQHAQTPPPNTVDDRTWKRVQLADIDRGFDIDADARRMDNYAANARNPQNS